MKKLLSIVLIFGMGITLSSCGSKETPKEDKKTDTKNESASSYKSKLKKAGFTTQVDGVLYTKVLDNKDNVSISIEDKYITYENVEEDSQIKYKFSEDTADMYGCKYHYSDDTTTEDGEGVGGCTEDTTRILKDDKVKIDNILKDAGLKYSDFNN